MGIRQKYAIYVAFYNTFRSFSWKKLPIKIALLFFFPKMFLKELT